MTVSRDPGASCIAASAMSLTFQDTLKQIGEYVKQHVPKWSRETRTPSTEPSGHAEAHQPVVEHERTSLSGSEPRI
jgi:hypothetical protein